MDKYAALFPNHPGRSSIHPPVVSAEVGSKSAVTSSPDGFIKPATPTTLVTQVKRVVQQAMQYLGMVKLCADSNKPPELETLKTTAYLLSLPTSKQLCLVTGSGSNSAGHLRVYKPVCKTLDKYNKNLRNLNEWSRITEKRETTQKALEAKLFDKRAQLRATDSNLANAKQQLVQLTKRLNMIGSKLQNPLPAPESNKLKAEFKQLQAATTRGEKTVTAFCQRQERIKSIIRSLTDESKQLYKKIKFGREALMFFQSALRNDLKLLDVQLAKAIKTPGSGHVGALIALRNGLRDAETLRGLRTDWRYWEMLGVSPVEYDDVAANSSLLQPWLNLGFSAKEALSFENANFTDPTKMTYLRGTGVTGPIAKQMHACGYTREFFPQEVDDKGHQVSAATYGFTLGMHHDAWAENDAIQIGSGAFNAPMGGYYRDTSAGPTSLQVFKKERYVTLHATDPTDNSPIPLQPGQVYPKPEDNGLAIFQTNKLVSIEDQRTPRIGLRNVLASRLAQALGLTIIVRSEFSARSVPLTREEIDSVSPGVPPAETFSFGISMQGVKGVYGLVDDEVILPADLEIRTTMIEETIDLQLFDAGAGQGDRHIGNIMVDEKGHVFGIDNDQCFPDLDADNPEVLAMDYDRLQSGTRSALLPRIITKEQRGKWLAMDEKTVIKTLHMATQKQRDAAVARFRNVQAHIRSLPDEQVVERSALTSEPVTKMLRSRAQFVTPLGRTGTGDTSYFGRYLD